jgi:hypothetical protein
MAKPATATRWNALREWLDAALPALNLSHWVVNVAEDASDVDAWADIDPHTQNQTAELRVSHDFWRQSAEKQRQILTHELVHLLTCRHDQVVESLAEPLGKIAWAVFEPQHDDAAERAVEAIAQIIAPTLDLPAFPKA